MGLQEIQERVHRIEEHLHSDQLCYPVLADPIELTAGAGWEIGTLVPIVPVDTITNDFDLHWCVISDPDTNDDYEVYLYSGDGDTQVAVVPITRTGPFTTSFQAKVQTRVIPANSRIRAALASRAGASKLKIKLVYHPYI